MTTNPITHKKRRRSLPVLLTTGLMTTLLALPQLASAVSEEELIALIEAQQAQIQQLKDRLDSLERKDQTLTEQVVRADAQSRATAQQLDAAVSAFESMDTSGGGGFGFGNTTLGGYGELHYNNLDADDSSRDLEEVDFHRFVLFFGHRFNDRVTFNAEFELEHGLVQDTDDGSNGGEVELEQAYIDFKLTDQYYARTGLFLIPVGILNETHEPPTFFGVERNDVENIILPSTWWEAGVMFGGMYDNGFSWQFAAHSGLEMPVTGSSAYRVRSGRQKVSNARGDNLAYTLAVRYNGVPGLTVGAAVQRQTDASQEDGDGLGGGTLIEAHGEYRNGPFGLRALYAEWNFDGSAIEAADVDDQHGWYLEPSWRFDLAGHQLGAYARYEDIEGARTRDRFDQWEVGFNYWPVDNVVLKVDYRTRDHDESSDSGRDFDGFDLGVGYQF